MPATPSAHKLVQAYIDGDADATRIIDNAVDAVYAIAAAREHDDLDAYWDLRQEIDEAIDDLLEPLTRATEAGTITAPDLGPLENQD